MVSGRKLSELILPRIGAILLTTLSGSTYGNPEILRGDMLPKRVF